MPGPWAGLCDAAVGPFPSASAGQWDVITESVIECLEGRIGDVLTGGRSSIAGRGRRVREHDHPAGPEPPSRQNRTTTRHGELRGHQWTIAPAGCAVS
jgi:hypothetical protein